MTMIKYLPNALAHPRAMVIKSLNTIIAYGAMGAPRRAIQHACVAILNPNRHAIDDDFLSAR